MGDIFFPLTQGELDRAAQKFKEDSAKNAAAVAAANAAAKNAAAVAAASASGKRASAEVHGTNIAKVDAATKAAVDLFNKKKGAKKAVSNAMNGLGGRTFIELTPDPFARQFGNTVAASKAARKMRSSTGLDLSGEFDHVRRPVRGIQLKDDTYATIQVVKANGERIELIDAGGGLSMGGNYYGRTLKYSNFLVQSITESREEKMQVVLTFGEPYVFFFGEQPRMIQVSGVLLNTEDFNWRAEWWENYDNYLRGTQCVRTKTRVILSWDDIVVEGYFVNCNAVEVSQPQNTVIQFNFTMFLTNYANISNIGETKFPSSAQEINLDPTHLDTTGEGIGNLRSSTLEVRNRNLAAGNSAPGSFGDSIIGTLAGGLLATVRGEGADWLQSTVKGSLLSGLRESLNSVFPIDNLLHDANAALGTVLGGRRVRVPLGAGGSVVFDEMQLAINSIIDPMNVGMGPIRLRQQDFTIEANLGTRWLPAKYGSIQDNTDEYVARLPPMKGGPINPVDLFPEQKAPFSELGGKLQEIFKKWGLNIDPPDELLSMGANVVCGIVKIPGTEVMGGAVGFTSIENISSTGFNLISSAFK